MKLGFTVTARKVLCTALTVASLFSIPVPGFASNGGGSTAINGSSDPLAAVGEATAGKAGSPYKSYQTSYTNSIGHTTVVPTRDELFRDLYAVSTDAQKGKYNDNDHMMVDYGGTGYRGRYIAKNYRGDGLLIEVGPFLTVPNATIAGIEDTPYKDLLDMEFPFNDHFCISRAMSTDFSTMYAKRGDTLVIHDYAKMTVRVVTRGGNPQGQVFKRVMPETVELLAGNNGGNLFIYKDYGTGGNSRYHVFAINDGKISEKFVGRRITGFWYDYFCDANEGIAPKDGETQRNPEVLVSITLPDGSSEIYTFDGMLLATVSAAENSQHEYPMNGYAIYWRSRGKNYYRWN